MIRTGTMILAGLVLAGCATQHSSEETLRQHGYSENYVAGYHDGCPSGKRAGGDSFQQAARDDVAYAAGGDYKTGWDYGFLTCRETEAQNERTASIIGAALAGSMSSSHGADGIDARDALKGIDTSGLENLGVGGL
ncbi:hypothetical protein [Roseobacter litoralis]|uniref:hypothetical protein n=1 Tax=Roseobacter litoralis TaxID=42443 RepID=UPI0024930710|nr:hypothetical protein [Roseobacter litoralis]